MLVICLKVKTSFSLHFPHKNILPTKFSPIPMSFDQVINKALRCQTASKLSEHLEYVFETLQKVISNIKMSSLRADLKLFS